jgi:hypothetical protein
MTSTDEEFNAKAAAFVESIDGLIVEHFGEGNVSVVIGLQVGDTAMLTSNLSPCVVGQAIHDMHDMAVEDHTRYHGEDGPAPYMTVDPSTVDPAIREQAERIAAETGVPVESIVFRQAVDMSDLDNPQAGLSIPDSDPGPIVTTGDDDIASPPPASLTAKDEADIAALNTDSREHPDGQH